MVEDSEQLFFEGRVSVFLDHAFILIPFIYVYACMR